LQERKKEEWTTPPTKLGLYLGLDAGAGAGACHIIAVTAAQESQQADKMRPLLF
jgi:hypothetical protein